ncbi:MAG: glycosyltransferase family 4 protein, partial [Candidatus Rokuibacteriota bacterium]
MRIALFTNNYLPFCGGVTISVETLRRGLESAGHEAWVFGPRLTGGAEDVSLKVVRYPSIPVTTYPEFALAVPYSRRIDRMVASL